MYQTETSECGLACLAIALERLGSSADLFSLRQKYGISTRGMTLREVRDIAADLGMLGRAIGCEVDELKNLKTPAILHWGLNHFVVLERADKRGVTITDPAAGKTRYKMDEVGRKFTGVAMELTATQAFVKRKPVSPLSLGSWYTWSRELTTPLIHLLVMSLLLQLFVLATPFYIQLAIDQAALRGDLKLLGVLALGFGALAIFSAVASLLRELVTIRLTSLLSWQMTLRLFRHLIRLPLPWYQRRKLADILSRFDAIIPVRELLTGALIAVVIDGLLAIGTLVMMFVFAPTLAWIVVCGLVLFVAIKLSALPLSMRLGMEAITARIGEHGKRIESIRAIQTVKVMGAETERENDWANKFANTIRADQKKSVATVSFLALNGCVDGVLRVVLIYAGARAVMDGSISIGLFYAFLTYHGQFSARSSALLDQIVNWRLTDLYSFRLADIVLSNKEAGIDDPALRREDVSGALELKNLSFAYAPREPNVFSNLSFSITAGEFVAVVGPSGCGKSTLLKVLCGLYPATHGEILIDGRTLSSLGPKAFRSVLGVVMQDDELMSGTIAENVCFFDEKMELDWVRECLRMAALLDEVRRMPMGVDTMIGDMGASLSGGQKQRLLLARALYRRPRILVLDEATSHLDKLKEVEINKALRALDITRIVVAHRQETIAAADRIIRLQQGRVSVGKMSAGVAWNA